MDTGEARGLYFDEQAGAQACRFFPTFLCHSKGEWAGKRFELAPPQVFILWIVFGWRRQSDSTRRFRRALIEIARKGAKSELASGVALQHLTFDDPLEPGAEVYLAATKEDQVRDTTFRQCTRMVSRSPSWLQNRVVCQKKSLFLEATDPYQPDSVLRPIGSDSDTSDGFDQHVAILDELHAWKKQHDGFYDRMTTAGGSRRQELVWFFTTAGSDTSERWLQVRSYATGALEAFEAGEDPRFHDHWFGFIACIDEEDIETLFDLDPDSEEFERTVRKANPLYPVTPKREYLRQQFSEAKGNPLERNKFLRFHANVQVSGTVRPIDPATWKAAETDMFVMPETARGGVDIGRSDDFSAWAVCGMNAGEYWLRTKSYTCAERCKELQTPQIQEWVSEGWIEEHPGDQVDFEKISQDIYEAATELDCWQWALDPNFARMLEQKLISLLGEDSVFRFIQTEAKYNEPCRQFVRLLKGGEIHVERNPCTAWQARNVTFKPNSKDEVMPVKGLPREYKIDAMVASFMAFGMYVLGEAPEVSVYDQGMSL